MNANSVVASAAAVVVGVTVAAVESVVLFAAVAVIAAVDGAVAVVVVVDAAGIVVDAAVGVAEEAVVADAARHSFPNDVASANQHLVLSAHLAPLLSFFAHAGLAAGSSDECCGSEILFVLGDAEAGKGVFVLAVDDV